MAGNLVAPNLPKGTLVSVETQNQSNFFVIVGDDPDTPTFDPAIAATSTGAVTLDCRQGFVFTITLNANTFAGLSGLPAGRCAWVQILVIQGSGGSKTLVLFNTQTEFNALTPGGSGLSLSTAAGAKDIVSAFWDGTNIYALVSGKDFK